MAVDGEARFSLLGAYGRTDLGINEPGGSPAEFTEVIIHLVL